MTMRLSQTELSTARCRRRLLLAAVAAALPLRALAKADLKELLVEVWKAPSCGCCGDWIKHMEANGFQVRVHDTGNTSARARLGIPIKYGSCHTALIDGYAIEGHVPAREIHRLLKERPQAVGLAAPGMPIGSPGMDTPAYKGRRDPYDVLLIRKDGSTTVYQAYG
jgi:hypothetical protein